MDASNLIGNTGAAPLVKDTTTDEFMVDVIEGSKDVPVLVDFWAPWCGPCRQLAPTIEAVVKASGGAVRLVKMNIDEHPGIAQQLGVQSIPAVFAFKDGKPVDAFMGALPESEIKTFVAKLIGNTAPDGELDLEAASKALENGDVQVAAETFALALQQDPKNAVAIAGLAKCYLALGELDNAEKTLELVPNEGGDSKSEPEIESARAALGLAKQAAQAGDATDLEEKLTRNPGDHQARFDLALAQAAANNEKAAMDHLFEIMTQDRTWNDGAAQAQLLQLFEAWGQTNPLTVDGRRRLSSFLFS